MTDIVHIPFHGSDVLAVEIDGKPHVILKPAFESIGIDADRQIRNLRDTSWATTAVTAVVASDGKTRQMVAADVRTFLMALARIPEKRVAESARPLLVAYQSEVADVIEAYWTQGGAINPRATEDQLDTLAARVRDRMEVLRLADGLVDPKWLEGKVRIQVAQALGEHPEIDPDARPLYVEPYLREKGLTRAEIIGNRSGFGRRLARAFFDLHGRKPEKVPNDGEGSRIREINGYTEADRPLFDEVWARWYADAFETNELDLGGAA